MQLQYFDYKMSFQLFIAISFYHNIVCKNVLCDLGLMQLLFARLNSQKVIKTCEKNILDSVNYCCNTRFFITNMHIRFLVEIIQLFNLRIKKYIDIKHLSFQMTKISDYLTMNNEQILQYYFIVLSITNLIVLIHLIFSFKQKYFYM